MAYVAYKKESKEKLLESTKYFGYRSSDDGVNKFEYVDDWGEKYVGLVSLSLNVLNTVTGEISTVGGIDDTMWTVGQPVFLPDIESDTGKTGKSPSYRLAYTAWKNGPKKLGMIYCYQRESSIFVVDLSNLLAPDSHASVDATKTSPPRNAADISETEIHVLVTPGIKLARSARGSPDGMRMIFLGSKLGFASHNGCSELFCIEVPDIIQLLVEATAKAKERKDGSTGDDKKNDRLSNDILMKTIVPSVACPAIEKGRHMTLKFPGIYADQLPRNCFLNDDCVVMSTPWGSVESIITVILSTGIVRKLDIPHHDLEVSSNILDVQTFKSSSEGSPPSKLLVTISTPSSSQSLAVLDLHAVGELVSVELCPTPDSYMPDQKPITRLKPTKKTSQEDSKTGLEKDAVNNVNDKKIKLHRTIDIRQKLNGEKKFDKLLKWETKKYQDANGIPFESILITPIMTEKGFMGFEDLGTSRKCPLIVVPHGGPHSCMTTTYVASYAFLSLYLGAAVLHVNFRGSTGFGQDSIDALLGTIEQTYAAIYIFLCEDFMLFAMTFIAVDIIR